MFFHFMLQWRFQSSAILAKEISKL